MHAIDMLHPGKVRGGGRVQPTNGNHTEKFRRKSSAERRCSDPGVRPAVRSNFQPSIFAYQRETCCSKDKLQTNTIAQLDVTFTVNR